MRARVGTTSTTTRSTAFTQHRLGSNEWFEYVIAGTPELLIRLAIEVGTDVVEVRVRGDMGDVLAARIDTAIDLL